MTLEETQDLHLLWEFDEELLIPIEMMNLSGIAARELTHGFDALPIGDRHEFGFVLAILPKRLNAECLFDKRLDANLVIVDFVLVGELARGSPAPDPNNCGLFRDLRAHPELLVSGNNGQITNL
jgi:hypothetical protein